MKRIYTFLGLVCSISILLSCTRTYIFLASSSYDLNIFRHKNFTLVGTNGILLKGFIKTYNERYGNDRIFIHHYLRLIADQLSQGNTFGKIDTDTSSSWNLIKTFTGSKEEFVILDSLFAKNNSDYILHVYNVEVSNRHINNSGADADGNTMTTRKEIAVVKARFQIIDRRSRKPVLEFESNGEKAVSFFNYTATLEKAMLHSIEHAVHYLQSGETKYKK